MIARVSCSPTDHRGTNEGEIRNEMTLLFTLFRSEPAEQYTQGRWAHRAFTAIVASKVRRDSLRAERERHEERRALPFG